MAQDLSEVQRSLDWLVTDFTERVADVAHAVVVNASPVARDERCRWCARCRRCPFSPSGVLLFPVRARPSNGINGALMPFPRHRWSIDVVSGGQAG
jgi:hypothetical protein